MNVAGNLVLENGQARRAAPRIHTDALAMLRPFCVLLSVVTPLRDATTRGTRRWLRAIGLVYAMLFFAGGVALKAARL